MNHTRTHLYLLFLGVPCVSYAALRSLASRVRPGIIMRGYATEVKLFNEDRAAARKRLAQLEIQQRWLENELQPSPEWSYRSPYLSSKNYADFVCKSLEDVQEKMFQTKTKLNT